MHKYCSFVFFFFCLTHVILVQNCIHVSNTFHLLDTIQRCPLKQLSVWLQQSCMQRYWDQNKATSTAAVFHTMIQYHFSLFSSLLAPMTPNHSEQKRLSANLTGFDFVGFWSSSCHCYKGWEFGAWHSKDNCQKEFVWWWKHQHQFTTTGSQIKNKFKSKENKKNRKDAGNERQTIKTEEHHRHVRQVFFVLHLHICQHMRTHFRKSMAVFLEKVVAAK